MDCCEVRADVPDRQRRVLQVVLWINAAMFLAESISGSWQTPRLFSPTQLTCSATPSSLYVVARGAVWQARMALLKGLIMAVFDGAVLAQIGVNVLRGLVPAAEVMGGIGLLAFIANGACLALLCVVASTTLTCAPLGSAR
jgi:hypothetical protein